MAVAPPEAGEGGGSGWDWPGVMTTKVVRRRWEVAADPVVVVVGDEERGSARESR